LSGEESDARHHVVRDMLPRLQHPPSEPTLKVMDVVRDALRRCFPDCPVDSGFGGGLADLHITVDGQEQHIQIKPSRAAMS